MGGGGSNGPSIQNPFDQSREATRRQQRNNASTAGNGVGSEMEAGDISLGDGGNVLDWDIRDTFSKKGDARRTSESMAENKARAKAEARGLSNQRRAEDKSFREEKSRKKRLATKGGLEKTKLRSNNKMKSAIGSMKSNMPRIG